MCLSICGPGGSFQVSAFVGGVQGRQQGTNLIALSRKETATSELCLHSCWRNSDACDTTALSLVACMLGAPQCLGHVQSPTWVTAGQINTTVWLIPSLECIFNFLSCVGVWMYGHGTGKMEWTNGYVDKQKHGCQMDGVWAGRWMDRRTDGR